MKTCFRCGKTKPLDQFNKARARRDGVQSRCRACDREMGRSAYKANPARFRRNNEAARQRARTFVWHYLAEHPCVDCGEGDPVVLEFDHVGDSRKIGDVAVLMARGYSVKTIMSEIGKCVVRCANCHRRKTHKQLGWWLPDLVSAA